MFKLLLLLLLLSMPLQGVLGANDWSNYWRQGVAFTAAVVVAVVGAAVAVV